MGFGERNPEDLKQENIRLPREIRDKARAYAARHRISLADAYRIHFSVGDSFIAAGHDPLQAVKQSGAAG